MARQRVASARLAVDADLEGGTLAPFFGVQAALATSGVIVICLGLLLWHFLGNVRLLD